MCIAFSGIFYRCAEVSPSTGTVFRCLFGLPVLARRRVPRAAALRPAAGRTVGLALVAGRVLRRRPDVRGTTRSSTSGRGSRRSSATSRSSSSGSSRGSLFGERPSPLVLIALPVVLAGVALISGAIGSDAYGQHRRSASSLGFATALCYAGYLSSSGAAARPAAAGRTGRDRDGLDGRRRRDRSGSSSATSTSPRRRPASAGSRCSG